ncbi:hypothetical protein B0H13DRAFT_2355827 [Mycena leptocephala]|nr:hypothetical protein B0H13DRAFT_2355827 [Mycena leptocephala]
MELLLPFGTSQGTATSPTSSQIPSDYRLDTAIYTTSRRTCGRTSGEFRAMAAVLSATISATLAAVSTLRRTPTDDEQIYYLTRSFDQAESQALHPDDPFAGAKRGKVIRNMTVPEIVLQAAESSMEAENIPRRWCHIGTRISKAADAHYTWIHSNITAISHPLLPSLSEVPKSHPSSPLSDLPMDMEVELPLEEPKQHANKTGNKKRKREKAEIGVEIPQAVQADRPQLRRGARTHKPRK